MPSDKQMAEWQQKPSSAPKQVKKRAPKYGQSAGSTASAEGGGYSKPAPGYGVQAAPAHGQSQVAAEILSMVNTGVNALNVAELKKDNYEEQLAAKVEAEKKSRVEDEGYAPGDYSWIGAGFGDGGMDALGTLQPDRINTINREKAMAKVQDAEDVKQRRADVLGISTGALVSAKPVLKQLTEEAYYELTPTQRAAVDVNTMLTDAVHKDKKRQDDYATEVDANEHMVYDRTVEKMFGEDGGSDLYAPETVAVLQQLKIKDPVADLDQYLNLSTAITAKDIKSIENPKIENFVNKPTPAVEREGVLATQITATQELQDGLARGKQMLQDWQSEAARDRKLVLSKMGTASPLAYKPAPGYGGARPEFEGFLKDSFDMLSVAKPGAERNDVLGRIKADMEAEGDDFSIFTEYVDDRTSNAKFYDAKLGLDTKDVKYMPADRYRDLLGLNK